MLYFRCGVPEGHYSSVIEEEEKKDEMFEV